MGNLPELLQQVRRGIADLETSRERVRTQITALEIAKAKLRTQKAQAAEIGRPDLAGEADGQIQLMDVQIADLTGMAEKLDRQIVELAERAGRLQARIDGPLPAAKPAKPVSYAMVKAAVASSMTFRGIITGAESSAMHLARLNLWGNASTTLCGKRVQRVVRGQWRLNEATCKECKRVAGVG